MNTQDILSVVTAFVEVFVFAGNIFGWFSLHFILEKENYFADECGNLTLQNTTEVDGDHPGLCSEQEASFNLVYTLGVSLMLFLNFPLGIFFDHFGTWIYRTLATTLYSTGYLLIAVSSSQNSALIYPSLIFIGIGGLSLLCSNIQTANFSKSAKGLIVTLLNGLFDSSVAVFFVFKKLYDVGINLTTMTWVMTGLTVFLWLRTYLLLPKKHVPYSASKKPLRYGWKQWVCFREDRKSEANINANTMPLETTTKNEVKEVISQQESFKNCLKTIVFWTNVFFFSVLSFRLNILIGTLQPWLKGFANENEISHFTDVVSILLMLGIFVAPLNGLIIDIVIKKLKKNNPSRKVLNLKAFLVSMFITSLLGITLSILIVIPTTYPTFVFMLLTRAFVFGGNAAFLSINFPIEHYGKLFGITSFVASLVSLLQYAVIKIVLAVDPTFFYINVVLLIFTITTLIHPLAILKSTKIAKEENTAKHVEATM